jgi:hypothetical protein
MAGGHPRGCRWNLVRLRAAIVSLHARGKDAIPALIDAIEDPAPIWPSPLRHPYLDIIAPKPTFLAGELPAYVVELLELQIRVHCDEGVRLPVRSLQQRAVLDSCPSHGPNSQEFVPDQEATERDRHVLVKQCAHEQSP